jgi:hypothetical protein
LTVYSRKETRKKVSAIGADLFSLYTDLNSIYVVGIKIVKEIEDTIGRWNRYRSEGRAEEPINFYHLHELLSVQRRNIIWFGNSFVRLSRYLDVVDPKTARAVALLISGKSNIVERANARFIG